MNNIKVVFGDITQFPADAILTFEDKSGYGHSGVDQALMNTAVNTFSNPLCTGTKGSPHIRYRSPSKAHLLKDGRVFVVVGGAGERRYQMDDVVFVIDAYKSPTKQLLRAGLEAAKACQYHRITIPALRTSATLSSEKLPKSEADVEWNAIWALGEIIRFTDESPDLNLDTTFVISRVADRMETVFAQTCQKALGILSETARLKYELEVYLKLNEAQDLLSLCRTIIDDPDPYWADQKGRASSEWRLSIWATTALTRHLHKNFHIGFPSEGVTPPVDLWFRSWHAYYKSLSPGERRLIQKAMAASRDLSPWHPSTL